MLDLLLVGPWHHERDAPRRTAARRPTPTPTTCWLLHAEEIDAVGGRHLGNFRQAFTHLAPIDAVMKLIAAEKELLASTLSPGKIVPRPGAHSQQLHRHAPA